MSTAAEESSDGKNHMPKVIIFSLIITMLLCVAASFVHTGMQNYQDINPTAGFSSAFDGVGLPVIATIISVFTVMSILVVMRAFLLGVTRVWFSMNTDISGRPKASVGLAFRMVSRDKSRFVHAGIRNRHGCILEDGRSCFDVIPPCIPCFSLWTRPV